MYGNIIENLAKVQSYINLKPEYRQHHYLVTTSGTYTNKYAFEFLIKLKLLKGLLSPIKPTTLPIKEPCYVLICIINNQAETAFFLA